MNSESTFQVTWKKVPLMIRVILVGFMVSTLGVLTWGIIATIIPMPWSFILMIGLLGLYIMYFSGFKGFRSTNAFRKKCFRRTKLTKRYWILGLVAAVLIVIIEQSGLVLTFRIMEFPADRFTEAYGFLNDVPVWAAWLFIIMISIVAGVCEETGFRGYMQVPLEDRYGPVISIGMVSLVFVVVHLHQAWAGPILIQIFFISILFGTIAYGTGSLIPGIIAHVVMDVFNFSFWWSDLGKQFDMQTLSLTGIDSHFIFFSLLFIIALISYTLILRNMIFIHPLRTTDEEKIQE